MVSGALAERIAAYRRRRGLSQQVVAGLVGRSESWLSQVERGVRSVVSPLDGSARATAVSHGSGAAVTDAFQARWVLDSLA